MRYLDLVCVVILNEIMKKKTISDDTGRIALKSLIIQLNEMLIHLAAIYDKLPEDTFMDRLNTHSRLLCVEQTAELLNLAKGSVYQKVSKGELPYYKIGRKVYFDKTELEDFVLQPSNKRMTNAEVAIAALNYSQN